MILKRYNVNDSMYENRGALCISMSVKVESNKLYFLLVREGCDPYA